MSGVLELAVFAKLLLQVLRDGRRREDSGTGPVVDVAAEGFGAEDL